MAIYFGKHTDGGYGFYHDAVHAPSQIPAGSVEISPEQHSSLVAASARGCRIAVDGSGRPYAVETYSPQQKAVFQQSQDGRKALYAGVQITSASDPSVNGLYACDDTTVTAVLNAAMHFRLHGHFPGDPVKLEWPDKAATMRYFANTDVFMAFSAAISNHNAKLKQVIKTGGALPPASESII
jgi:hypothetical protein